MTKQNFSQGDTVVNSKEIDPLMGFKVVYGSLYTIDIRKSTIDSTDEYFLIDQNGKELPYPFREYELQLYFKILTK